MNKNNLNQSGDDINGELESQSITNQGTEGIKDTLDTEKMDEQAEKIVNILKEVAGENDEIIISNPMGFKTICLWSKESEKYIGNENPIARITFTDEGINIEVNNKDKKRIQGLNVSIQDINLIEKDMKKFLDGEDVSLPEIFKIDSGLSKNEDMSDEDIAEYLKYYNT